MIVADLNDRLQVHTHQHAASTSFMVLQVRTTSRTVRLLITKGRFVLHSRTNRRTIRLLEANSSNVRLLVMKRRIVRLTMITAGRMAHMHTQMRLTLMQISSQFRQTLHVRWDLSQMFVCFCLRVTTYVLCVYVCLHV